MHEHTAILKQRKDNCHTTYLNNLSISNDVAAYSHNNFKNHISFLSNVLLKAEDSKPKLAC